MRYYFRAYKELKVHNKQELSQVNYLGAGFVKIKLNYRAQKRPVGHFALDP